MHWTTRAWWTAVVALHCAPAWPVVVVEGAIRVLAFPKSSHVPIVHPTAEDERRPEAPDMLACLWSFSYTCLQRKTAVYLDALNRMDRIRLLGDFVTAVRTRPVDAKRPTIDERMLDARGLGSVLSLSVLVDSVVREMIEDHVLRISFPSIAGLGGPYSPAADASARGASGSGSNVVPANKT